MPHAQIEERAAAILRRRATGLLAHDEALAELADANCATALAVVIAERVCLCPDMVRRALDADTDEAISVICRAAGFTMNSYSAMLRMRRRHNRGTDNAPAHALMFFSDLSRTSAKTVLARLVADFGRRKA
jgi:hypothetical protein